MQLDWSQYHYFDLKQLAKFDKLILHYSGDRHDTYLIYQNDVAYQLRLNKKTNIIDRAEIDFIRNNQLPDFIYIDDYGHFIKRWIEGATLSNLTLNDQIMNSIIAKIKEFRKYHVDQKFKWFTEIDDSQYQKFLKQINSDPGHYSVTSHCDLRGKNIVIDEKNQAYFLDVEWVCASSHYHDPAILIYYLDFPKQKVIEAFNLEADFLDQYVYAIQKYDQHWRSKLNN